MPLIDKDVMLEELFDSLGSPDATERSRLSRASDEGLYALAAASPTAILVNWWDHASAPARLRGISSSFVEVFCDCPTEVAAARFLSRSRHRGHHDQSRTPREIHESFEGLRGARGGPLGMGEVIRVDTGRVVDADLLTTRVRRAVNAITPPD